jgi:alpha,alpha-trehalase
MIVPGGRFIEFYYWDTFWIVKGLLVSGMNNTAQMIVENLLELVKEYGFVPNGSRRYYLTRSQPPYLALMVDLLVQGGVVNSTFLEQALPVLDAEYHFWMVEGERAVDVSPLVHRRVPNTEKSTFTLNRYYTKAMVPRAESAREDLETASHLPPEERPLLYQQLIAGAETGWDYTTRWFKDASNLATIDVTNLLPVDLNAVLFKVEKVLAQLHTIAKTASPVNYANAAGLRAIAIHAILWNSSTDQWFDFNVTSGTQTAHVSPANFLPIWAGCLDPVLYPNVTLEDMAFSLKASGLIGPGGTCGSLIESGQQWDYPNVWPPLQQMLVEGFVAGPPQSEARKLGEQMATTLLHAAYIAFNHTGGYLLEKYNCTKLGAVGGGGEYELQTGFGWTNGAILSLLELFPDTPAPEENAAEWGSYFSH